MTKFELPEKPKKTNTSEDFNNLRKAVDELDKFDYTWKTYANKADRRINAANKYIEELERENQRLIAENVAVKTLVDNAKPQQSLPVVPECVAEFIENYDDINEISLLYIMKDFVESNHWDVFCEIPDNLKKYGRWDDMLYKAIRFGYTVAKEKRYEVVFLEDDTTRQILMENKKGFYFIQEEYENYGYWKQDFTEMEIKEINEKFWQLSVPVKDEQIEVEE